MVKYTFEGQTPKQVYNLLKHPKTFNQIQPKISFSDAIIDNQFTMIFGKSNEFPLLEKELIYTPVYKKFGEEIWIALTSSQDFIYPKQKYANSQNKFARIYFKDSGVILKQKYVNDCELTLYVELQFSGIFVSTEVYEKVLPEFLKEFTEKMGEKLI